MEKTLYYIVILSVAITATQASYCREYNWGGTSGVHYFTCCDNCDDVDNSCDRVTYQGGGSTTKYCDTCGLSNSAGGGSVSHTFRCTSCTQQSKCKRSCGGVFKQNLPGLCWKWSQCFRGCCKKSSGKHKRQGNAEDIEFCGDFTCQSGEDHVTCPSDCCPMVNPDQCLPADSCSDMCCNEPSCCKADAKANNSATRTTFILPFVMTIALMLNGFFTH